MEPGAIVTGQMVAGLRRLGFDKVLILILAQI